MKDNVSYLVLFDRFPSRMNNVYSLNDWHDSNYVELLYIAYYPLEIFCVLMRR